MEKKTKKTHSTQQILQTKIAAPFASIIQFSKHEALLPENAIVVLGLSGGPDSVFLLHFLLELKKRGDITQIIAAHLDHEWRKESGDDAAFCKQLAEAHGIPFETLKMSELISHTKWNGSKEEIGRNARRMFFESIAKKYGADAIALGQHAQDQQETFFIRLLRGTSLTGLCGIWPKRGSYIRPLLQTNKSDILAYLHAHDISYLEDPSNVEETFLRNRIRKSVIPALQEADSRFDVTFEQTIHRLQETEQYLDQHARDLFSQMSSKHTGAIEVSIDALLSQPPIMQSRLIMLWLTQEQVPFSATQSFIDELIRFLQSEHGGTHALHPSWQLKKKQRKAIIEKK